jgi:hypothetical protein
MKNAVLWDMAQCGFIINRRFGGTCRSHVISSALKMEAVRSFEMSVYNKLTLRHIPEHGIPHTHRRENLSSCIDYALIYCTDQKLHLDT